ncbi:hypothetical protein DERF_003711 [Dermatophagoides farinae]|uniref:Uncharacterized protein n=1 Tax=Dermatophagoides farinae TaxID=6954 RepID=A0A922ID48_DERFA|nr:hypothetical protein DERF_003711 [Dermatophagoides farinae]
MKRTVCNNRNKDPSGVVFCLSVVAVVVFVLQSSSSSSSSSTSTTSHTKPLLLNLATIIL